MEVEFIACSMDVQKAIWLRRFYKIWDFKVTIKEPLQSNVIIKQQLPSQKTPNIIVEPNTLIPSTIMLDRSLPNEK